MDVAGTLAARPQLAPEVGDVCVDGPVEAVEVVAEYPVYYLLPGEYPARLPYEHRQQAELRGS